MATESGDGGGAVQSSDVKDASLRVTDLRPGAVAALTMQDLVIRPTKGTGVVSGGCNPGEQLVGGGVLPENIASPVSISTPFGPAGGGPQLWVGRAADRSQITVMAICSK